MSMNRFTSGQGDIVQLQLQLQLLSSTKNVGVRVFKCLGRYSNDLEQAIVGPAADNATLFVVRLRAHGPLK